MSIVNKYMGIVKQAEGAQVCAGYSVDKWLEMELQPMTKLWQGVGGVSNFFVSEEDAREARGSYQGTTPFKFAQTLWRLAQVEPNRTLGYRDSIAEFVVDVPVMAAVGLCTANKSLGSGTVFQYYISNWQTKVFATGRTFKFDAKSY